MLQPRPSSVTFPMLVGGGSARDAGADHVVGSVMFIAAPLLFGAGTLISNRRVEVAP